MDRMEILEYLKILEPVEELLKVIHHMNIDWHKITNKELLELYRIYGEKRQNYSYEHTEETIESIEQRFANHLEGISEEEFLLYFKEHIHTIYFNEESLWEENHLKKAQYFQEEGNNIQLIKHTRYSKSNMHDHDFIEMAYMLTGQSQHAFIIKDKKEECILREGDILLIPPGMSHEVAIYDDSVMMNVLINRETFQESFLQDLPKGNVLFEFFCKIILLKNDYSNLIFHTEKNADIRNSMLDLIAAYMCKDEFHRKMCDHYLSILFLNLIHISDMENVEVSADVLKAANQIIPMLTYIQKNYTKTSLEKVAAKFHYSQAYTNRIFKKYTGNTILQYIQQLKMQEAKKMLEESELSVEEICYSLGYQDVSYFIENFKKKNSITPYQFRLSNRKIQNQ